MITMYIAQDTYCINNKKQGNTKGRLVFTSSAMINPEYVEELKLM